VKQRNPNLHAAPRAVAIPSPAVLQVMRDLVTASGGNPLSVPDMPYKLMRPAEIIDMFAISIATFYRMIEDGTLPRPIPIDRASLRVALALQVSQPTAAA
jgi:predicted DNA-binding transcriptional regulator AlpA